MPLRRDQRGANLVEYILIVGLLAMIALGGSRLLTSSASGRATAHAQCVAALACGDGDVVGAAAVAGAVPPPVGSPAETSAAQTSATPTPPPSKGLRERALDVGKGIVVDGLWGTITGVWTMVTHPIETGKGIVHAVAHPVKTATAVKDAVAAAWEENPERLIGGGIFEVITLPAAALKATKASKVTALTKAAKAADKVDDAADAARLADKASDTSKLKAGALADETAAVGMPKKLATNLTKAEAAAASRYSDDLARVAANIEKNPLGTAKELADLKWDNVKVSWNEPIEKGVSEFRRIAEQAKKLAKEADVPENEALEYLIDENFNSMLRNRRGYYYDPQTGVVHVPKDFLVYKDGVNRPLDLNDPIERAWAERHARVLVEEHAHGAGSAVRAGEYAPLTPKLHDFKKWLDEPTTRPWLDENFSADEVAAMGKHMHEADISALLRDKSPFGAGELGRYEIRQAYEEFIRRSGQPGPPAPPN
jgi:Flp pilus assembly pilin Flp